MTRLVLEIRYNGRTKDLLASLKEPGTYPGAADLYDFGYDGTDREPAGFAAGTLGADEMGAYILTKLSEHPAVIDALKAALAVPQGTQQPVFIQVAPQAEDVPWETLFANGSFLALDQRWPIGRISTQDLARAEPREFRPPLRVMAVLAAAGIDAMPQWVALREALAALRFPVEIRLLVAQDTLRAEATARNPANLTVTTGYVERSSDFLPAQITGFRPNILHFFCHGGISGGAALLDIATRGSFGGSERDGATFDLRDFPAANPADDLWLVLLNACKGALPPEGASSLVSSLAARGVPAVAGMREAVTEGDAHAFCGGFYRELTRMLSRLDVTAEPVRVDWCNAIFWGRREICDQHRGTSPCSAAAAQFREWTLPVMYVSSAPFVLRRPDRREETVKHYGRRGVLPPEQRTALEAELQILRDLVARQLGAPSEVILQYQQRILTLQMILGS